MAAEGEPLLQGIRVVEVATFVFGPAAGTVLADFGADVVKVEHPVTGDPYRYLYQLAPLPRSDVNYPWILDSRNKKSIAIDLKTEQGRALVLELVRDADIFITNFHPSVLADLHVRYEDLSAINERLIYAHATGYGERGAEVEKPGYDATAWWARSGLMDAVCSSGSEPALATAGMGDHPSALALLSAIALALYARERSGRGTKVSTSLIANGAWANGIYLQAALCGAEPYEAPGPDRCPNALVTHYATGEGRRLYLAMVREAVEWERFCTAIERTELMTDPRFEQLESRRAHALELRGILGEIFRKKSQPQWREILDRHGVTFGVVATTDELPHDEQLIANGVFRDVDDPERPGLRTVDSPLWIEGYEKVRATRAPAIGEHSREILRGLGYDDGQIADLENAGVVRSAP